jgi:hypothetical protein
VIDVAFSTFLSIAIKAAISSFYFCIASKGRGLKVYFIFHYYSFFIQKIVFQELD